MRTICIDNGRFVKTGVVGLVWLDTGMEQANAWIYLELALTFNSR
jgi:hypothetical protein